MSSQHICTTYLGRADCCFVTLSRDVNKVCCSQKAYWCGSDRGPFISCLSNGWSKDICFLRNFTLMIIQRGVFCYYQSSWAWGLNLVCFELGTCISVWMFDVCFVWPLSSSKREPKYHKLDLRKEKERENSNLAVSCWLPASTQLLISQPRIWWLSENCFPL